MSVLMGAVLKKVDRNIRCSVNTWMNVGTCLFNKRRYIFIKNIEK